MERVDVSAESAKVRYTLQFVDQVFAQGLIDRETCLALKAEVRRRIDALHGATDLAPPRVAPSPAASVTLPPPRPDVPVSASSRSLAPPGLGPTFPEPLKRAGGLDWGGWVRWGDRADRLKQLVASDFALHGLAYLGVLLMFAGAFGFVFFAFGDVARTWRPLAEIAIPGVLFGSAWFLGRRGANLVSGGLELVAGALLPVVVFASFADRAGLPPDVRGNTLVAALTVTSLLLAGGYAAWSARRPDTPLRYLALPLVWLAVMALGFVFKHGEPLAGLAIERPVAAQAALAAACVSLCLLLLRFRRDHRLTGPTFVAAVPGIYLSFVLTLILGKGEGWPRVPLLVSGLATVVASEFLGERFGRPFASPFVQGAVLGAALAAQIPAWGVGRIGVAATVAYILLFERHSMPGHVRRGRLVAVAGLAAGLGMALAEPWTTVGAWSAAAGWAHARRWLRPGEPSDRRWIEPAAVLLPIGAAAGLLRAMPDGEAWMALAAAAGVATLVARTYRRDDPFLTLFLGGAAGAVVAGVWITSIRPAPASLVQLSVAAGIAAVALAVGPRPAAVRVWTAAAAAVLTLHLAFAAARLEGNVAPAVWALVGLAAVAATLRWTERPAGHLAAIGHLTASAALAVPTTGGPRVTVLAAFSGGWLVTVVAGETGKASLVELLTGLAGRSRFAGRLARGLPGLAFAASLPFVVVRTAELWPAFARHRSWTGVALSAMALGYGGAARGLEARRPLVRVLATGAGALSVIAVAVAAPRPWPVVVTAAGSIALTWLLGGGLRRPAMTWFAWAMSGVLAVVLAERAGVPVRQLNLVALTWGGVLFVGGLALDDLRSGRRARGEGLRLPWLVHPVVMGAVAVPVSVAPVFTRSPGVWGWWCLALALFYLAVAGQLRAGAVSGVSCALATLGLAGILPWPALDRPWMFVAWAALLVAGSWTLGPRAGRSDAWFRWDLPPLVVAHGVAALALVRSAEIGFVPATWIGFGALSLAQGAWRRDRIWADAGNALALVGAGAAGFGLLALALAGTSLRGIVVGSRADGLVRTSEQAIAVWSAGAAWLSMLAWLDWSPTQAVSASAVAFGAVGLASGVAARRELLGRDWVVAWGALATAGIIASSAAAIVLAEGRPGWPAVGGGLVMLAGGFALAARPMRWPWLREGASVLVLGGGAAMSYAFPEPIGRRGFDAAAAGFAVTVGSLSVWRRSPRSPWLRPLAAIGVVTAGASIPLAASAWPRRGLLVGSLLAAGVEVAAAGLTLRRPRLVYGSPVLLCTAWLVFASEALSGNPEWFTVPVGLTLLTLVELGRWSRRTLGLGTVTADLLVLELLGIGFLVGSALTQILTESPAYGLLAVALSGVVAAWGGYTTVRRRAMGGAGLALLAVVLMLAAPVAQQVHQFHGAALWITVAAVGTVLILVATFLEQGRARVGIAVRRLAELMEGWE